MLLVLAFPCNKKNVQINSDTKMTGSSSIFKKFSMALCQVNLFSIQGIQQGVSPPQPLLHVRLLWLMHLFC